MILIRQRFKEASDRQKSYADRNGTFRQFLVGDKVFLRVKPHKSSISFRKSSKLALIFVGLFDVLEVINPVAYKLALPPSPSHIHDVFHVSFLKSYHPDASHILDWHALQVQDLGVVLVEPIQILDQCNVKLHNRDIAQYRVQWDQYSVDSATWENAKEIDRAFPHLRT
ncbi:uncharacterized protein LOC131049056 [Cryptomeria japonica]|uniref:uncharacterized protein LOC131049056 n=1 Tax=Cryptomeria japonica TaxID=3369 RepID=UPI0027D9DC6A|nr:uncharacterized protein LOC131049056 [Cryptomeria japonica]